MIVLLVSAGTCTQTVDRLFHFAGGASGEIVMQRRRFPLRSGRMYLIPLDIPFRIRCFPPGAFGYVHFTVAGANGLDVFREVREVIDLPTLPWLRDLAPLTRPLARPIDAFALPLAYLAAIAEFVRATDVETPWVRAAVAQPLQRVLDLIRERNSARLRIRELAAAAGMSSAALSYTFQRAFGHSLKFHLTQDLLQRAMHDLVGTNKTVRQIALNLGYARPAYFAFAFRRVLGLPPLKYRAVMHPRGANRQLYAPFPPEDRKLWSNHLRHTIPTRQQAKTSS